MHNIPGAESEPVRVQSAPVKQRRNDKGNDAGAGVSSHHGPNGALDDGRAGESTMEFSGQV